MVAMFLGCNAFWEVESQVGCGTAVTGTPPATAGGVVWGTLDASGPGVMGLRCGRRVLVHAYYGMTGPAYM